MEYPNYSRNQLERMLLTAITRRDTAAADLLYWERSAQRLERRMGLDTKRSSVKVVKVPLLGRIS
jgi:hypothetical protein